MGCGNTPFSHLFSRLDCLLSSLSYPSYCKFTIRTIGQQIREKLHFGGKFSSLNERGASDFIECNWLFYLDHISLAYQNRLLLQKYIYWNYSLALLNVKVILRVKIHTGTCLRLFTNGDILLIVSCCDSYTNYK